MYNLNEKVGDDYFPIDLDGYIYKFYYPSSEDIIRLEATDDNYEQYAERLIALENKIRNTQDEAERQKLTQEKDSIESSIKIQKQTFLDWCVSYIKPESDDAPEFKAALLKKNIKYLLAFTEIVKAELNG